jgi:hypothetical protein
MQTELAEAYKLINDFKLGIAILKEQAPLIIILGKDLGISNDGLSHEEFVQLVADTDSAWNTKTQTTIDQFYNHQKNRNIEQAENVRLQFIQNCPQHGIAV